MVNRFANKTAIITGAASGIGLAVAKKLLHEGACVVINDIDESSASKTYNALRKVYGEKIQVVVGDAGSLDVVHYLVDQAIGHFGHLDFAIANAGITPFGDFFSFGENQFKDVLKLNLQGTFFLAQAAARQMRKQGKGGSILITSSVIGMRAYPELTAYAMTKAALSMMARSLVLELSPYQIRINTIAPGATITPRTAQEAPDYPATWSALIPLQKCAKPEDIAGPALFLLSDEASHITGQTLVIDGGWTSLSPNPVPIHSNKNE
jgi:3-oxoacyl-[acyl-carrier protein] reductase